jgi:hypothetical protein
LHFTECDLKVDGGAALPLPVRHPVKGVAGEHDTLARPRFTIGHWIWHQKRAACT